MAGAAAGTGPATVASSGQPPRAGPSCAVRNRIVEEHLWCVDHFVHKYRGRGVADDDLRQTAFLALVQAADRFDPELDVLFRTFASRTIDGSIKRYFRDRTWSVRPPRAAQELYLDLRRADEELTHRLGRRPTVAELAREVDTEVDHVLEALEAGTAQSATSLDRPIDPGDTGGERTAGEQLGADDHAYELVDARATVTRAMAVLSERDREIIYLRFFENLNQEDIAERVGVSQSYLSRVIARALRSMQAEVLAA